MSAKFLAGAGRRQQNFWQVSAGVKHVAGDRHAAHTHTHTHRQNMGIGTFLQHQVWCDHRTIVFVTFVFMPIYPVEAVRLGGNP